MQTANALVALGGDRRNTVPRTDLTPAEILVLQSIHAGDAVFDIEIVGETQIGSEDLRDMLRSRYTAKDEDGNMVVDVVFPGRRPDFPETFEELGLPDELYLAVTRAAPARAGYSKKKGGGKKTEPAATTEPDLFTDTGPMG